jgi:hypothetical protein
MTGRSFSKGSGFCRLFEVDLLCCRWAASAISHRRSFRRIASHLPSRRQPESTEGAAFRISSRRGDKVCEQEFENEENRQDAGERELATDSHGREP